MARLEEKIDQISDPNIRKVIREEVKKIKNRKQFGLVFEQHIPEAVPIYSAPILKGSIVAKKTDNLRELYAVKEILGETAEILNIVDQSIETVPLKTISVVKRFGEPIYPALVKVDSVSNNDNSAPHHILIEADNYHALQLLEYVYPKKVDCIYIDPPYNTGAKDWKYNNNYVDSNDTYRHSKWLSMMQKRLTLSKQLLSDDGVLILTIDDYELYHIGTLLEEIFSEYDQFIITIEHNRRGRRGKNFAKTNEFALFLVPKGKNLIQEEELNEVIGGETRNLRRTGSGSLRTQRWKKFFPIYVNEATMEIVGAGEAVPLGQAYEDSKEEGIITVWPIDEQGVEKNWHYGLPRTREQIEKGTLVARKQAYGVQVYYTLRVKKSRRLKTVWSKSSLDASTHGTELLAKILGKGSKFDFPKSVYSVLDCIKAVVGHKENALILDFFAGSGTTLHSVLMLNEAMDTQHQCILVTNNEVSGEEATILSEKGHYPGEKEWEAQGIAKSVTFPRSKYTILGKRDDGSEIPGEYMTGVYVEKEKPRTFKHLGFIDGKSMDLNSKKQLVALIDGIPQSKIKADTTFFVDSNSEASIIFDDDNFEEYLESLESHTHITNFYILTKKASVFKRMKAQINSKLGPLMVMDEGKRLYSSGFSASLDYFKLDFLNPNEVAMGMQFKSILPLLWMMAGAKGEIPEIDENQKYMISEECSFAVLLKEQKFNEFYSIVNAMDNITHVFIVTNSEDAFFEMKAEFSTKNVLLLYKDYLKNFEINRQWKG